MPTKAHLLIVDDEANTLASLSRAFRLAGHQATVCDNAAKALELAKAQKFDLILSDVVMPVKSGLSLLEDLKAQGENTPVVMMSGQADIEMAVRATRLGALDFLEKPISTEKLLLTVENALKLQRLESENRQLKQRLGKHEIVWQGEAMQRVMAQVARVAASESRVCILGETGTGKELVARTIHERSARAGAAFITLNCAAVPAELIESELFGHEKGSFTGAAARHVGKFEQANHGTIFLDEIGDMPLAMQAKLLRVLEDHKVRRLGGRADLPIDVRVVAATNKITEDAIKDKLLREDLFYRLNVFNIHLPALRDRKTDIAPISEAIISSLNEKHYCRVTGIHPDVLARFWRYSWPGNVRELRNVLERAVILAGEGMITEQHLEMDTDTDAAPDMTGPPAAAPAPPAAESIRIRHNATMEELEDAYIRLILKRTKNNKTTAAEILGISVRTLHNRRGHGKRGDSGHA